MYTIFSVYSVLDQTFEVLNGIYIYKLIGSYFVFFKIILWPMSNYYVIGPGLAD